MLQKYLLRNIAEYCRNICLDGLPFLYTEAERQARVKMRLVALSLKQCRCLIIISLIINNIVIMIGQCDCQAVYQDLPLDLER